MLTEKAVELLRGAQNRIKSGKSQFLCIALSDEADHLNGYDDMASYMTPYTGTLISLRSAIEEAILGCYTFDSWLFSQTGFYPDDISENAREIWSRVAYNGWHSVPRKKFLNWCTLARMAWVDRILETGEIA